MPFSIQFLGVGGAFALPTIPGDLTTCLIQSNMVITAENGKRMLFDCGTDIRFSAQMCGFGPGSFDAVYISHEHADHSGGLEWLLLQRLFGGGLKPQFLAELNLCWRVWKMLQPSLMVTTKGQMRFDHFVERNLFNPTYRWPGQISPEVVWENLKLNLFENVHVLHRTKPMKSYGMLIKGELETVSISADTVFSQTKIGMVDIYADVIFQDCEVGFKTGVHAHYEELLTLPESIRAKMWLYHYNPAEAAKKDPVADGFRGFVTRGQMFEFN